jgi:hypothetical protein
LERALLIHYRFTLAVGIQKRDFEKTFTVAEEHSFPIPGEVNRVLTSNRRGETGILERGNPESKLEAACTLGS